MRSLWRLKSSWRAHETVELMVDFNTGHVSAAELGGYLDGIRRFAYFEDFLFGNARDAD